MKSAGILGAIIAVVIIVILGGVSFMALNVESEPRETIEIIPNDQFTK